VIFGTTAAAASPTTACETTLVVSLGMMLSLLPGPDREVRGATP